MSTITTVNLSTLDWFTLVSTIASLILAVLAIWLAIYFFVKSKNSEKESASLLVRINSQTDLLHKVSNKLLDKYVAYSTQPKQADETYVLLAQVVQTTLSQGLASNGTTAANQQVMQELTTIYIAVLYYSALSNVYLQGAIPSEMTEAELEQQSPWLRTLLDRSSADFFVANEWLNQNGGGYIESSTAKQYYQEMTDGEFTKVVKDTFGAFAQRQARE
jgi:hypothetical protein